jgi:hypothetical protein
MSARKKAAKPPSTLAQGEALATATFGPREPKRERDRSWDHKTQSGPQHGSYTVRQLVQDELGKGQLRLPLFQRTYVWTDAQVVRLLESLEQGFHVGSLLLWESYGLPPAEVTFAGLTFRSEVVDPLLVVDGQQRLGALRLRLRHASVRGRPGAAPRSVPPHLAARGIGQALVRVGR